MADEEFNEIIQLVNKTLDTLPNEYRRLFVKRLVDFLNTRFLKEDENAIDYYLLNHIKVTSPGATDEEIWAKYNSVIEAAKKLDWK